MQKIFYLILLIFLFIVETPSFAAKNELFEVQVPLSNQMVISDSDPAFTQGFYTLLMRITGNPKVQAIEAVKTAQAKDYLQQYKTSSTAQGKILLMSFNEQAVIGFLKSIQQPLWLSDRPISLMWIVLEQDNSKEVLSSSIPNPVEQALQALMDDYSLPVVFPIYDLQDINKVAIPDVIADNISAIRQASMRYRSDAILVGHINAQKKPIESNWTLYLDQNNTVLKWSFESNDISEILKQSSLKLLSNLAEHYRDKVIKEPSKMTVTVENISTLETYNKVLKQLKNIRSIESIETQKITPNGTTFIIEVIGGLPAFLRAVEASPQLLLKTYNADQVIVQWRS